MKDNEWAGVGNHIDYGARGYDTRIARFISVDPLTKKYPSLTPYQFASLTPIWAKDLDGKEAWYSNNTGDFMYGPFSNEYIQQNNLSGASFMDNGGMAVDLPEASIMSSNVANTELSEPAWEGNVVEYKSPTSMRLVRAYTEGVTKPEGSFLMRADDIKGLSDVEIQDKFAMPNKPTNMVDVDVPQGTTVREGTAAGNKWGKGGGTQFQLREKIPGTNYGNNRVMPIRQIRPGVTEEDVAPGSRTGRSPISPESPIGEEPMELPESPETPLFDPVP